MGTVEPVKFISFTDIEERFQQEFEVLHEQIRKKPDSISKLAHKLHRSRSAIDKDVQLLESVGIVESEYVINPGHSRCRIIKAIDTRPIKLQVETII